MSFLASEGRFWPLTASITSEAKIHYAYVIMQGICNKFIDVNFCVRCIVSQPNCLLQDSTTMSLINETINKILFWFLVDRIVHFHYCITLPVMCTVWKKSGRTVNFYYCIALPIIHKYCSKKNKPVSFTSTGVIIGPKSTCLFHPHVLGAL